MIVRDLMSKDLLCVLADYELADLHALMRDRRVRHLPVMSDGQLVGIVSDRDLLLHARKVGGELVFPPLLTASDIMTRDVVACSETAPLEEIAAKMIALKIDALPVTNARGDLVGLITSTDLLGVVGEPGGSREDRKEAPPLPFVEAREPARETAASCDIPLMPLQMDVPESVI
jgi:acetoin utilization protein AcuB